MIVCLVAECLPGSKQKRILELGAAGLSMGLLLGFSIATIEEAVTRLIDSDYSTENPNGWIGDPLLFKRYSWISLTDIN